jgi:hypothetical protein
MNDIVPCWNNVSQSPGNREVGKFPNFEISLARPNFWKLARPEVDKMFLRRQEPVFPDFGSEANDNHGGAILAITGATTTIACIMVLARLYVRAVILKTFGFDDWSRLLLCRTRPNSLILLSSSQFSGYAPRRCTLVLLEKLSWELESTFQICSYEETQRHYRSDRTSMSG